MTMTKKQKLDKDSEKRLEKLTKEWLKKDSSFLDEKLTIFDLRLLLENFAPLQDLIRALAATAATEVQAAAPAALAQADEAAPAQPAPDYAAALAAAQQEKEAAIAQWQLAQAECSRLQSECQDASNKLEQCTAMAQELHQQSERQKQEIKNLKDERKQLGQNLQRAQNELAAAQERPHTAPELALLRQDPQLAQDMGLGDLPADDTQALIQTVAVLAQLDNLKRLWAVLKDRCEAEKRPATDNERALLQAAMAWHNHNWRSLPYRLIEPAPGSAYDYTPHMRCRHVTKGETVAALHLPGIADGSGQPLCKALVLTK